MQTLEKLEAFKAKTYINMVCISPLDNAAKSWFLSNMNLIHAAYLEACISISYDEGLGWIQSTEYSILNSALRLILYI